jgi:3-methyladenine DNA glycosylase/8-oxoguanine DNA glycosylase
MRRALDHLRKTDPILQRVIERVGPYRLKPRSEGTHFDHIARAIVYQQLSGKAAATIHGRVCALFPNSAIDPALLLAMPDEQLRAAGLSRAKALYLHDLAARTTSGELQVDGLHALSDDEILAQLVAVKGVGVWTAQMFLMFRLGRPDILPGSDLGIRKGVQMAYGMRSLPTPRKVEELGARWAPYRTIAAWYLWRLLDVEPAPRQQRKQQAAKRGKAKRKAATRKSTTRTTRKRPRKA